MKKLFCMLLALLVLTGSALAEAPGSRIGFEVLRALSDESANQVISPLSLAYALAMAAEGAVGQTRQEILDALGAEDAAEVAALQSSPSESGLRQANAAFLPGRMVPNEDYVNRLAEGYGAKWFGQEETSVKAINRWTEDVTDGMIDKILDELPDGTQLVLLNAIAMDAKWQSPFNPDASREDVFHAPGGDETVMFMHKKFHADYGERENVQLLRLRYRDCGLSMLIALPEAGGMDAVLDGLCAEGLDYFSFREDQVKIDLSMPRTDIAVTNGMNEALQSLGVERAFSDEADFSGITQEMPLKIDSVLQKARMILDEDGTRAAAATAIVKAAGAMPMPEEIVEFDMNRPFAFVIADEASGAVCFAGIVANPTGN